MEERKLKKKSIKENELKKIIELVESVEFGTVSIIIQDSTIVQLEKNEKLKLK